MSRGSWMGGTGRNMIQGNFFIAIWDFVWFHLGIFKCIKMEQALLFFLEKRVSNRQKLGHKEFIGVILYLQKNHVHFGFPKEIETQI